MSDSQRTSSTGCFPTTQWTQVIEVIQRGDATAASAALNEFCTLYSPAVYSFFRRRGCTHDQADDHTQEFFRSRILKHWEQQDSFLHSARRSERGKFRSFLSHVLWRFLQDEWRKEHTAKAGGAIRHLPLEAVDQSGELARDLTFQEFGREFDRAFALQIIQRAAARSRHSTCLLAHLRGEMSQEEAAARLGLSVNAFRQAYHRFRQRLALDLRQEVARLVGPDEKEILAEIQYLMSLFT